MTDSQLCCYVCGVRFQRALLPEHAGSALHRNTTGDELVKQSSNSPTGSTGLSMPAIDLAASFFAFCTSHLPAAIRLW